MSNLTDFLPAGSLNIVTTTVTTNVQVSGSVWGDGPTVGIADNDATELVEVTNSSGDIGRVKLPNVTTMAKTVYFKPYSGQTIYVDYTNREGNNVSIAHVGGATIPKFIWLGSWVRTDEDG